MIKEKYEVKRFGLTLVSTDEKLSSRFGLSALASLLDELKLDQQADRIFPKPGSNRAYSAGEMVHAWILMLHEGCDRLEDINQLKKEKHLLARLGFSEIPDADTLGRWLKRHGELGSKLIQELNRTVTYQTLRLLNTNRVTFDLDATAVRAKKKQVRSLIISMSVALGCVRIDAAGYQREVIEYLDSEKIEFVIRAHLNGPVKELIASVEEEQWQALRLHDGNLSEREWIVRRTHIMNASNTPFDVVIKRKLNPPSSAWQPQKELPGIPPKVSYNYHVIATNISRLDNSQIVHLYKQRGEYSENRIKELKSDFAVKHLPCSDFAANSFYVHLCALAYNVLALLRVILPPGFRFARASKVRSRVYSIGGKIIRHSRQWILLIEAAYYQFLKKLLERLESSLDWLAGDIQYPLRN